ncbi:glycosyltransferase family 2 protein [Empedobacter falsenii]|uniref:glycosyltransferase family 2 protein n=1 Tax=Empedobacter falsenii TaxID=343874 RepID=UPI0025758C29|nr:glycosyltransferase family 2 protein [Empedobacter falsenii]MDM1547533.1 glycosyltransferase family 2 protein [Empedobacter falsenii]
MKFSVLIANYNNWEYFQECYKSINNQTYQDFEIIIVDDCSTDDSYEKLLELSKKDNKIKLFRNSENKKVGYTKRRCIQEANGEVCGFVDPDDKITITALQEVIEAYEAKPTCIATYSKIKLINNISENIGEFKLTRKIKNNKEFFLNINFEVAHFFSFKRDVYNLTEGINATLTSAVDQDLYMKLYEKGSFYFIDSFQYLYRLHDKGVSQDKSKKVKLNQNWHQVLLDTCKRRGIEKLYGKSINNIDNLPKFFFKKENTFIKRLLRKLL